MLYMSSDFQRNKNGHQSLNSTCREYHRGSIGYEVTSYLWYTHKTSDFKTSGFKTSGFKTSEMSGLQNVRFTKRQVYKMSGLQNVRSSKRLVAKKHPYIFCTCGWWKSVGSAAAMLAGKVMAVFYSLF